MVEIIKTNVSSRAEAKHLVAIIEMRFYGYKATFDLEDRDRVLRVVSDTQHVCGESLVRLMTDLGYSAEILKDEFEYFPELTTAGSPPLIIQ